MTAPTPARRFRVKLALIPVGLAALVVCALGTLAVAWLLQHEGQRAFQPWFTEHLAISPGALPNGVGIGVVPNTNSSVPAEYLVITNTSQSLLYLTAIEPPNTGSTGPAFTAPPVQPPSRGIPVYRVASGQAFVWGVTSVNPPWSLGWQPVEQYGPSDALWLYVYRQYVSVKSSAYFDYHILKIEARNQFDYGGQRPTNVQIPAPQTVILPMAYGVDQISIPLTISYALNETYETPNNTGLVFLAAGIL